MVHTSRRKELLFELLLHFTFISLILISLSLLLPTIQPLFKIIGACITLIILSCDVYSLFKKNLTSLKIIRIVTIYFFVVILIVFAVFYLTKLLVLTDAYGFENLLKQNEATAKLIYFAICFAQPIILPIPEVVTVAGASAVFGPITAIYLGFLGTLTGIVIMYLIAKYGGQRIVTRFVKEVHLKKYQNYVRKNEVLFLVIMFIIPILPDEIICIGAGLGAVSFRRFIMIAAISKLFTATLFAYSVELAKLFFLSNTELILYPSMLAAIIFTTSALIKRKSDPKKEEA